MQKGLDLLRHLPDSAERDRQELKLQLALGGALIAVNGYAAEWIGTTYVRAHQLCEKLRDTPSLYRALWGEFVHHHVRAETDRSHRAATELLRLAEREHDKTGQMAGHRAMGDSLLHLGRPVAAREHLEMGVTLSDTLERRSITSLFAEDARVASLSFLSLGLAVLGFVDQALARDGETLREARSLSHPISLAFALSTACRLHSVLRNERVVGQLAEELIALTTEQSFAFFLSAGTISRGWALLEEGESTLGMEILQSGIAGFKASGAVWILPMDLAKLATAYRKVGRTAEGTSQLSTALTITKSTGVRWCEAELHRLLGDLLLAVDGNGTNKAEPHFGTQLGSRVTKMQSFSNYAPPSTSLVCGLARISRPRREICWRRSMAGSLRASITVNTMTSTAVLDAVVPIRDIVNTVETQDVGGKRARRAKTPGLWQMRLASSEKLSHAVVVEAVSDTLRSRMALAQVGDYITNDADDCADKAISLDVGQLLPGANNSTSRVSSRERRLLWEKHPVTSRTWIGGGDNEASNPAVWDPPGVPQPGDDLRLPSGKTIYYQEQ